MLVVRNPTELKAISNKLLVPAIIGNATVTNSSINTTFNMQRRSRSQSRAAKHYY
jgi:hypothetical protein